VAIVEPPPAETPSRKLGSWERLRGRVWPRWLMNKVAAAALEGADIILDSIPGAEPIKELKEVGEMAIKALAR
jgi:hypothetical protein